MKKIYLHPDIFYVENFLTREELIYLYWECISGEWPSANEMDPKLKNNWLNKIRTLKDEKGIKTIDKIRERIYKLIPEGNDHLLLTNSKNLKKYRVGDEDKGGEWAMNPHHDAVQNPWKYGVIVYLNDNYMGGELVYTNLGIEFKPKAGPIVMHAANDDCVHAVKKVISGTRYMMTFFAGDPSDEIMKRSMVLMDSIENIKGK